jgi:hypothetical protein
MAYIHLRVKSKEGGEEILKNILSRYAGEIIAYDLEEYKKEVFPEPEVIMELRNPSKKGGSLSVTIPNSIRRYMNLQKGDILLFIARKKVGRVYLEKVRQALLREQ